MPYFICPNCKNRSIDGDGRQGLLQQAVACDRCGFGFLFELLDDYYPAPNAGFVVCDNEGRVLAVGRGVFELTGYRDSGLMGQIVWDALGLDRAPADLTLEWGVRRLNEDMELRTRGGQTKPVRADFFPAYDEDGGLLLALSPR